MCSTPSCPPVHPPTFSRQICFFVCLILPRMLHASVSMVYSTSTRRNDCCARSLLMRALTFDGAAGAAGKGGRRCHSGEIAKS